MAVDPLSLVGVLLVPLAVAYILWRKASATLVLTVLILAVFLLVLVGDRLGLPVLAELALVHVGAFREGELLASWTSLFVHFGFLHLAFNLAFLILIGLPFEERIGPLRFLVLFFASGLFGTLLFYVLRFPEVFVLGGASGAIAGVLGGYARLYPNERVSLFLPVGFLLPPIRIIWLAIGFLAVSSLLVFANVAGFIAHEAHVGGIVMGFAIAPWTLRLPEKIGRPSRPSNLSVLRALATTPDLQDMVARIEAEEVAEIAAAWTERFARQASCPRCGQPLELRGRVLRSSCGWKERL